VRDHRGTSTVEYGLILGFIVITMLIALNSLAESTISMWDGVSTKVETAR
jgi:pilus assembly protein Flp/PilA